MIMDLYSIFSGEAEVNRWMDDLLRHVICSHVQIATNSTLKYIAFLNKSMLAIAKEVKISTLKQISHSTSLQASVRTASSYLF